MGSFKSDQKEATKREIECVRFLNRYSRFKTAIHAPEGRHMGDMYDPIRKEWSEIKTDKYNSGNFFIERYSKFEEKKQGGPWQYSKTRFWIQYHYNQGMLFLFKTKELLLTMEALIKDKTMDSNLLRPHTVPPNKTGGNYHTFGYVVNQKFLCEKVSVKVIPLKDDE